MIRAISVNRLKPVIDRSFGLESITAAFKHFQAPNHFGKIILEI
jgi:NADPH:quinone reductase-like Zn-dependent oxidoreductase